MIFCSSCGAENKDGANFCMKCGNSLSLEKQNVNSSTTSSINHQEVQQTVKYGKNPVVAVLLNFFLFWGLGYWYLGIKKIYGLPWYALIGVQFLIGIIFFGSESSLILLISIVVNISLAYDVYQKALSKPGFVPVER